MRLFGPTHEDIWKIFSEDIDAKFIADDSVFKKYEVKKEFHNWTIVLDTCNSGNRNRTIYTRVHCIFSNKHGFKFKVFGEYFDNYFPSFFDMKDIKVNYDDLSDKFVIRSNSEMAIKILFENEEIRNHINMQTDILLETLSNEEGHVISIKVPGIIKNNEVLKNLFELVGEILLEIENINNEIENLEVNNFNHFDVIKNSFKNGLLESVPYKNIKKEIISSVNNVLDKTSHYHSHKKKKNFMKKDEINEMEYTESKCNEIDSKPLNEYRDDKFLITPNNSTNKKSETANIDTSKQDEDINNISNHNDKLETEDNYLKMDDSYLKTDDSYLKNKE